MSQLVMGTYSVKCRCGKVVGLSEEDAKLQCRRFSKKHNHYNAVRYYVCPFGSWHWTSELKVPDKYADTTPAPVPPTPTKPKKKPAPTVHHVPTINWTEMERVNPDDNVIIQKSRLRGTKWFWRDTDGTTGYADDWDTAWLELRAHIREDRGPSC